MYRVTAALALAAAVAPVPAAAQPVRLRFTPPVGQVTHYKSVSQTWMQIPGLSAGDTSAPAMTQTLYTTKRVTAMDGANRVVTTMVDSSTREVPSMSGMMPAGDPLRGMLTTQRIDERGHIVAWELTPPPGLPPQVADALKRGGNASSSGNVLPQAAVKPGDTWADSMEITLGGGPGAGGPTHLRITYRLDGVEQRAGARVALISMTGSEAAGAGATVSGQVTMELGSGRIIRSTRDISGQVQGPSGTLPIRIRVVTEALP